MMRDYPILFSVKREFKKIFFVIRDLKVSREKNPSQVDIDRTHMRP